MPSPIVANSSRRDVKGKPASPEAALFNHSARQINWAIEHLPAPDLPVRPRQEDRRAEPGGSSGRPLSLVPAPAPALA